MSNDCPCTKDCPDRNYEYCKTCEKQIAYKNKKLEQYSRRTPEQDYKYYRHDINFRYAVKSAKFKKRNVNRRG